MEQSHAGYGRKKSNCVFILFTVPVTFNSRVCLPVVPLQAGINRFVKYCICLNVADQIVSLYKTGLLHEGAIHARVLITRI